MEGSFKIFRQQTEEIVLSPALPSSPASRNTPDTRNLAANGHFGHLHLQEIKGAGYTVWQHNYFFNKEDTITFIRPDPGLRLWIALKRSFYYTIEGLHSGVLHERGFNISYVPFLHQSFHFSARQTYTCAEIYFSRDYLDPLIHHFSGVEEFLQKMDKNLPASLDIIHPVADMDMLMLLNDILHCPYPPAVRKKLLANKIWEILILSLGIMTNHSGPRIPGLDKQMIERFYHAVELLTGNLARTYSLKELSEMSGISLYHLKQGFKVIYGLSMQEFLYETRMQKARLLLEETDFPIGHIAAQTGYSHPFAFSSAYKKYFGHAPSLVQKSRKNHIDEYD
jgi:AraC-like DNA-binding protein